MVPLNPVLRSNQQRRSCIHDRSDGCRLLVLCKGSVVHDKVLHVDIPVGRFCDVRVGDLVPWLDAVFIHSAKDHLASAVDSPLAKEERKDALVDQFLLKHALKHRRASRDGAKGETHHTVDSVVKVGTLGLH